MAANPDPANPGAIPPPVNPAPDVPPANQNWFSTITDPDITGYIQNRGLHTKSALDAFVDTAKAHREAQSKLSIPSDRLLQLPNEGDVEATKAFWQKLGAPADSAGYAFEGIDFGDAELTTKFVDAFRSTAANLNMPKEMAEQYAKAVFKTITDVSAAEETASTAALAGERAKLEADWGPSDGAKFAANMLLADRAATVLGVGPEEIAALKDTIGGARVAQMFRDLGLKLGEAKYVADPNNARDGIMTREQAIDRRFQLMGRDSTGNLTGRGDPEWVRKVLDPKGGTAEKRELADLNRIIAGDA